MKNTLQRRKFDIVNREDEGHNITGGINMLKVDVNVREYDFGER